MRRIQSILFGPSHRFTLECFPAEEKWIEADVSELIVVDSSSIMEMILLGMVKEKRKGKKVTLARHLKPAADRMRLILKRAMEDNAAVVVAFRSLNGLWRMETIDNNDDDYEGNGTVHDVDIYEFAVTLKHIVREAKCGVIEVRNTVSTKK